MLNPKDYYSKFMCEVGNCYFDLDPKSSNCLTSEKIPKQNNSICSSEIFKFMLRSNTFTNVEKTVLKTRNRRSITSRDSH